MRVYILSLCTDAPSVKKFPFPGFLLRGGVVCIQAKYILSPNTADGRGGGNSKNDLMGGLVLLHTLLAIYSNSFAGLFISDVLFKYSW